VCQAGAKAASWPTHSCGNTAIKAEVGPNFGPTWRLSHLVGGVAAAAERRARVELREDAADAPHIRRRAWEKKVVSARGFKRVDRHSSYSTHTS
jgi:hypothetical protein